MSLDAVSDALAAAHLGWLALAVALQVGAQVCRGLAWHGTLAPLTTAAERPGRRRVCSWHVTGAGLTGVLSARGGDAVRLGLARRDLPDRPLCTLAGTLALETSSETLFGVVTAVLAVGLGVGALPTPGPVVPATAAAAVAVAIVLARRSARVRRGARDLRAGLCALRDPARYAATVLPFQLVGRTVRLASLAAFLLAFGLPASPAVVLAVCAAQGSGRLIPVPGVGTAAAAAGLLLAVPAAAGHPVDHAAVAALAVAQPALLSAVGLTLSTLGLAGLLGAGSPRALVRAARGLTPASQPA